MTLKPVIQKDQGLLAIMDHDLGFYIVLGFIIVGLQNLGRHIMASTGKVLTRQLCSLLLKHRMGYVNTHYLRPRRLLVSKTRI